MHRFPLNRHNDETVDCQREALAQRHITDKRQLRSWTKLSSTVLKVCGDTPASQVRVADIARSAGINRSTFYSFAPSVSALLSTVLIERLSIMAVRSLGTGQSLERSAESPEKTARLVVDHVVEHLAIYRTAVASAPDAAVLFAELARFMADRLPTADNSKVTCAAAAAVEAVRWSVSRDYRPDVAQVERELARGARL